MNNKKGFTLVELLIVIALIGIMLFLGIPTFKNFLASNRAITQVNQMVAAINFARSEAIKNQMTVTLCPSNDGRTCSQQWHNGWIVFIDKDNTGHLDTGDTLLRAYPAIPAGDKFVWQGTLKRPYLQMSSSGSTRGQDGTFVYCPRKAKPPQFSLIKVSQTGRVRIAKNDGLEEELYKCG